MSTVTLHSYLDDPMKQQHGDIGKHVQSPLKITTIMNNSLTSDAASDTTTVADDDEENKEDYSFVTGSSDITLAQDEVAGAVTSEEQQQQQQHERDTSLPSPPPSATTPTPLPLVAAKNTDADRTDNNLPSSDIVHVVSEKTTTNNVKLHNLKSRFKQALRLSPHPRRRRYVDADYSTTTGNSNMDEDNKYERYRESIESAPPTCHLEHYHPAAAVPTLSYAVCGPGSKSRHPHISPPPATLLTPPPTPPATASSSSSTTPKMPVKGILKKPPPQELSMDRIAPPSPEPSTTNNRSSLSSLSSTSSQSSLDNNNNNNNKKRMPTTSTSTSTSSSSATSAAISPATKRRTWLNKLRSTMMSTHATAQQLQQQQTRPQERKRTIRYNKMVIVHETYTRHEYNREPDPNASCTYLTAEAAQEIKNELNFFKFNEMIVHPSSRIYTHFFI